MLVNFCLRVLPERFRSIFPEFHLIWQAQDQVVGANLDCDKNGKLVDIMRFQMF